MLRHRCGTCWLRRWMRTGSWRGWRRSCARRTRGCGRRTRGRLLSWRDCALTWRFCSGWCSGGRRSGRARSRRAVPAVPRGRAGCAGPARGGSAARGRGRGGGITRTCPGSRWSGIFPGAGTAARSAGSRSRGWAGSLSAEQLDWQVIVRLAAHCRRRYRRACDCRVPATVTAPGPPKAIGKGLFTNAFIAMLLTERFAAGRSMNSLVTGLARQGAEISPGDAGRDVRAGRGAAGPAGGGDHGAVAGLVAPARGRDDVAGLRAAGRGRPGEVVAVGVPRPGHRVLRHGPDEVRGGPGPPRRHRRGHRAAHRGRGRRAAAAW